MPPPSSVLHRPVLLRLKLNALGEPGTKPGTSLFHRGTCTICLHPLRWTASRLY